MVDLAWDEKSGERSGLLRLTNLTKRPLPLKLSSESALKFPALIDLKAGEAKNFKVSATGVAAVSAQILVESELHQELVKIEAKPPPARLEVIRPAEKQLSFELMDTDKAPEYEIVVKNVGGEKAYVYAEAPRPFIVRAGQDPTELAAGKEMTIKVSIDPSEVGSYSRQLTVLGTANQIQFALNALVTRNVDRSEAGVSLPNLEPLVSKSESMRQANQPNFVLWNIGRDDKRRVELADIPIVQKIYLEEQSRRKLVISWDHPGDSSLDYIVEFENYEGEEGKLPTPVWYQVEDEYIEIEKTDKLARATLKKLAPGRRFRIRVRTINKDGHSSYPTRAERVQTLPAGGGGKLVIALPILVIGGVAYYVWRRRQEV